MLETVGKYAQCQNFSLGHGLVGSRSIGKDARQLRNLRKPTAVFLAFALRLELHGGYSYGTNGRFTPALPGRLTTKLSGGPDAKRPGQHVRSNALLDVVL